MKVTHTSKIAWIHFLRKLPLTRKVGFALQLKSLASATSSPPVRKGVIGWYLTKGALGFECSALSFHVCVEREDS